MCDGTETIAVVVVTYASESLLADMVASLEPGFRGLDWHLTVADNASPDNTVAVLRGLAPHARVVQTGRNAGYAAGINAAVARAAPHTAVLVLNPDVRLGPDCVRELVRVMRERNAGIVVPRLLDERGAVRPSQRREPTVGRMLGDALFGARRIGRYGIGEVVTDLRQYTRETAVDWAEGAVMLIDRECWRACGPWDETFFLYSEETEYALRARDRGFTMFYVPRAEARHLGGESTVSPGLWTLLTLNRVRLFRRRHGLSATAAYWAALVLREAIRAVMGKRRSRAAVRALFSAVRLRETPGPASLR